MDGEGCAYFVRCHGDEGGFAFIKFAKFFIGDLEGARSFLDQTLLLKIGLSKFFMAGIHRSHLFFEQGFPLFRLLLETIPIPGEPSGHARADRPEKSLCPGKLRVYPSDVDEDQDTHAYRGPDHGPATVFRKRLGGPMEFPFTGLVPIRHTLEIADAGKSQVVNVLRHGQEAGLRCLADDVGAPVAVRSRIVEQRVRSMSCPE